MPENKTGQHKDITLPACKVGMPCDSDDTRTSIALRFFSSYHHALERHRKWIGREGGASGCMLLHGWLGVRGH